MSEYNLTDPIIKHINSCCGSMVAQCFIDHKISSQIKKCGAVQIERKHFPLVVRAYEQEGKVRPEKLSTAVSKLSRIKVYTQHEFDHSPMRILLDEATLRLGNVMPPKICCLDVDTTDTIINCIRKETIDKPYVIEQFHCKKTLSKIIGEFIHNHKKFRYNSVLTEICKNSKHLKYFNLYAKKEIQEKTLKWKLQPIQLQAYFQLILHKVVPQRLFGTNKNRKQIMQIICHIIKSYRHQEIDMKTHINKLQLKDIDWLRFEKEESTKWIVVTKVVKWFINHYILSLLYLYVHVTFKPDYKGERLFILRTKWNAIKSQFIKNYKQRKIIKPVNNIQLDWCPPTLACHMIIINRKPKLIVKHKYTASEKLQLERICTFLKQLNFMHYGRSLCTQFRTYWKQVIENYKKPWLVSCDLQDAYGSVLLEPLCKIIEKLSNNLPDELEIHILKMVHHRAKNIVISYKKYFTDIDLILRHGMIYVFESDRCSEIVTKKYILKQIYACILKQKVQINCNTYVFCKGLPRGSKLSSILCEIYYNYVLHEKASLFLQSGVFLRHVDDILYVTESFDNAARFERLTKIGFPQYNCKFNVSKTQSNLYCADKEYIEYLGHKVYYDTMETVPTYPAGNPFTFCYVGVREEKTARTKLKIIKQRAFNTGALKLSHFIILDEKYSDKRLVSAMKISAKIQAGRIVRLIAILYPETCPDYNVIMEIIKKSNQRIVNTLIYYCIKDTRVKGALLKTILSILWAAYKRAVLQYLPEPTCFMQSIKKYWKTSRL